MPQLPCPRMSHICTLWDTDTWTQWELIWKASSDGSQREREKRMAQPEPVAMTTARAVWSQQPARPWPHKAREGGRGAVLVGHKSGSSMPLTQGRRFMGLQRAQKRQWGEARGSPCSHHPWGPCRDSGAVVGRAGSGAQAWQLLQATLSVL